MSGSMDGVPPPPGSQAPSGLPIPGEGSQAGPLSHGESPDQAFQRAMAAQMAGQPPSSSAAASMQRPPAPLFVGHVSTASRCSLMVN